MKYRFRLLLALLVVVSLFTGCSEVKKPTTNMSSQTSSANPTIDFSLFDNVLLPAIAETEYGKFGDSDWGMTVEQAVEALGYNESDFINEPVDPNSNILILTKENGLFNNIPCAITLKFESIKGLEDSGYILVDAMLNTDNEKNANEIIEILNNMYSPSPAVTIANSGFFFDGKAVYNYCNQSTWTAFISYYHSLITEGGNKFDKYTAEQISKMTIGSISFKMLGEKLGSPHYRFTFSGRNMAILKCI